MHKPKASSLLGQIGRGVVSLIARREKVALITATLVWGLILLSYLLD